MSIELLVGKTVAAVRGLENDSYEVFFDCDDGTTFRMFHDQDCCEIVSVAEFDGHCGGLVHSATERTEDIQNPEKDYHGTWTFYVIESERGTLHLRWGGYSNGYYSEAVSVEITK